MTCSIIVPWARIAALVLIPILSLQCASTPSSKSDVERKIAMGVAEGWTQHLLAEDMKSAMTLVDESFTSIPFPTRDDLQVYLDTADQRDYFTGSTSDFSAAELAIKGKRARIYPVKLHTPSGSFIVGIYLSRNGSGWMVAELVWELY